MFESVESSSGKASKAFKEQSRRFGTNVRRSKFGVAFMALHPDKPALVLSQLLGISERNALQLIRGERKITARAMHVLNAELLN